MQTIILRDNAGLLRRQSFPCAVALPEIFSRRELVEGQFLFDGVRLPRAVVKQKGVTVGTENEGNIEGYRVLERLLHAGADRMVIVFGFDDCQPDAGFVGKDVIGAFGFATS